MGGAEEEGGWGYGWGRQGGEGHTEGGLVMVVSMTAADIWSRTLCRSFRTLFLSLV